MCVVVINRTNNGRLLALLEVDEDNLLHSDDALYLLDGSEAKVAEPDGTVIGRETKRPSVLVLHGNPCELRALLRLHESVKTDSLHLIGFLHCFLCGLF